MEYLVSDGPVNSDSKGCPWKDKREILEGILWIVKTCAPCQDLPKDYTRYHTCYSRFEQCVEEDIFDKEIETLSKDLQGKLDHRHVVVFY